MSREFGLLRLAFEQGAVLFQVGEGFQIIVTVRQQLLEPGVFAGQFLRSLPALSNAFGSAAARLRLRQNVCGIFQCADAGPFWISGLRFNHKSQNANVSAVALPEGEFPNPSNLDGGRYFRKSYFFFFVVGASGLGSLRFGKALLEFVHTPGGVHELLLAGVDGWQALQMPTMITGRVNRVLITLPQAQRISASTYFG